MHEGHRQRLLSKLESGDNLYEHEILEILLFNAYPRRDVNPIAHALLQRFAGIKEILTADVAELCTVEGVGENVALYLKCIGKCLDLSGNCDNFGTVKNTEQFKKLISMRFRGKSNEYLELYFLDKGGRVKRICSFTSDDANRVDIPPEDIAKLISVHKPYGIFVAHNHVNCSSEPSYSDDQFTKQVQLICSISNVKLYDHCIYSSDNDIYSYFISDRIDQIKQEYNISELIRNKK
jgi:DNA repair protein RadC